MKDAVVLTKNEAKKILDGLNKATKAIEAAAKPIVEQFTNATTPAIAPAKKTRGPNKPKSQTPAPTAPEGQGTLPLKVA